MTDPRPNIVLILVDDADVKTLNYNPRIRAAIADHGASASRFFLSQPLCGPSRASIWTGRYPHNTGVQSNQNAYANFIAGGGEASNVALWMQAAGYSTALVGKYMNHYPDEGGQGSSWVPPGWDYWFGLYGSGYDSYDYTANLNGTLLQYGNDDEDYATDVLAGRALEFLGSDLADDPFMLFITPMAPHSPSVPARRYASEYAGVTYPKGAANPAFNEADVTDKPFYVGKLPKLDQKQIKRIDERYRAKLRCLEAVADLVDAVLGKLAADGKLDNTYVFFTTDNGFHMGEHRLGKVGIQDDTHMKVPGGKNTMYEEDIHVPMWIRGPGIAAGSTVDGLMGNVDLASTFCEIAGATPGANVDGRSALPLLHNQAVPWRTSFLIGRGGNASYAGIRLADETVFTQLDSPQPYEPNGEFYDLVADPHELENGYKALPVPELAALLTRVQAYRTCSGDSCRVADSS